MEEPRGPQTVESSNTQHQTNQSYKNTAIYKAVMTGPKRQQKKLLTCIDNQKLSYIFILISSILLVCGYMFSNQQNIDPVETNFIRFLTQFFTQIVIMRYLQINAQFKKREQFKLLIIRGILAAGHAFAIALCQYYLPLTVVFTLNSSGIIFLLLLNYIIYHVRISKKQGKALVIGVIGILLTITGRFIYHLIDQDYDFQTQFQHHRPHDKYTNLGLSLGFMAWMAVWAFSLIYGASKITVNFNQGIFLNSLIGLIIYSVSYLTLERPSHIYIFLKIVLTTGVLLTISNYFFSWGLYISTNIGLSSMVNQFAVIVSYAISILVYDQEINYVSFIGNILVVSSIYVILLKK